MPLFKESLSLWEIAHRSHNSDPDQIYWVNSRIPLLVKDTLRTLADDILSYKLTPFNVSMEKRPSNSDIPAEFFIRAHTDTLYACLNNDYHRRSLNFIEIEKDEFQKWCEQRDIALPEFWFSHSSEVKKDKPLSVRDKAKLDCQQQAKSLWGLEENKNLLPAHMSKKLKTECQLGQHYQLETIKRWIREVAPKNVLNKHGRPPKKP